MSPPSPESTTPPAAYGPPPGWSPALQVRPWLIGLLAALLLLAFGLAITLWRLQDRFGGLERELVRRQQNSTEQVIESGVLAKQAQEGVRDLGAKVALLDTRLGEVALQRTQLEELIQSMSRSRDENVLTDIEASIRVALQQAAITGSAEQLVTALRSADERLARLAQPRFERLRRALAHDLERTRAANVPDLNVMLLRLDEAVRAIDELPLTGVPRVRNDEKAARPAARQKVPASQSPVAASGNGWDWSRVTALPQAVWDQARQLVEVRRIDHPEAMLLAPDQEFFLRENLKLRLLNARLALLSRQSETAQGDLQMAISTIDRYFDRTARRTQLASELLKQASQQVRLLNVPRPDESLAAIATATAGR
jgi:uroporphyrin-3 C-methyltransferase